MLTIAVLICVFVAATECRQGWKTYGNGYFIYTSETSFSTTNQFNIHGIFSAMPNVTSKHALLSVYDADDVFAFQIMIGPGLFYTAYKAGTAAEEKQWNAIGISEGYAYAFTVTVSKQRSASGLQHRIRVDMPPISGAGFTVIISNVTLNFTSIKIKIGGNSPDPVGAQYFEGCLSNFTFKGVDIIRRYFAEYPNNVNPVKGRPTFVKNGHKFSEVAELCDDVLATTRPTESGGPSTTAPWSSTLPRNSPSTTTSTRENNGTISPSVKTAVSPTLPTNDGNSHQIFGLTLIFSSWLALIAK